MRLLPSSWSFYTSSTLRNLYKSNPSTGLRTVGKACGVREVASHVATQIMSLINLEESAVEQHRQKRAKSTVAKSSD